MLKQQIIDKLTTQLGILLSSSPVRDIETNLKAILTAGFDKLNLVTREEFEIQQQLLLTTRIKLEELEKLLSELERNTMKK